MYAAHQNSMDSLAPFVAAVLIANALNVNLETQIRYDA
jgi:uncharacterized MAPEG superfamily protein